MESLHQLLRGHIWILTELTLEDREIQNQTRTDKMGHNQIFLGDLGGFGTPSGRPQRPTSAAVTL